MKSTVAMLAGMLFFAAACRQGSTPSHEPQAQQAAGIETAALKPSAMPSCQAAPGRAAESIHGEVAAGKPFTKTTPSGWVVRLKPIRYGWILEIATSRKQEDDLSRLTPPWHATPNPREIEGWHFRNADNTAPNDGTVNAPGELREFIFSPQVGAMINFQDTAKPEEAVARVRNFGQGWLYLEQYQLSPAQKGQRAALQSIRFSTCLTWPASATPPRLDQEDEAIARVKHLDVHDLDPTLDNAEFRYWFPAKDANYALNDCGEGTGGPSAAEEQDIPFCVEVRGRTSSGKEARVSILVGNLRTGVFAGKPVLFSADVQQGDLSTDVRSLSELAKLSR